MLLTNSYVAQSTCGLVKHVEGGDNPLYVVEDLQMGERTYRRLEQLGEGGSGLVYLVQNGHDERLCMKEFRFGMRKGDADAFRARDLFVREANTLKSLNHPQIPHYVDFFVDDRNGEEKLYLVMEYIPGKDFAELAEEERFTQDDVIEVAKQVCNVLSYTHGFTPPIVHRDIKPQNLARMDDETIKVLDFGSVTDAVMKATRATWTSVGTIGFTAPEAALYGKPEPASDIYSLGATMLWMLSGGGDIIELFRNDDNRLDFRGKLNVDGWVEQLIWDMTEPNTKKRIRDVEELRGRLYGRVTSEIPAEIAIVAKPAAQLLVPPERNNEFNDIKLKVHGNFWFHYDLKDMEDIDQELRRTIGQQLMEKYGQVTFGKPEIGISFRGFEGTLDSWNEASEIVTNKSHQRAGILEVTRPFFLEDSRTRGSIYCDNRYKDYALISTGVTYIKIEGNSFTHITDLTRYTDIFKILSQIKL